MKISISDLCASSKEYKKSQVIESEIIRRGFKDCSESELYCQESLGLKPKTSAYVTCRMQRDQHNLQKAEMIMSYLQSTQKKKVDIDLNVHHQPYPYSY